MKESNISLGLQGESCIDTILASFPNEAESQHLWNQHMHFVISFILNFSFGLK